jgi:hypothetical protein
MKDHVKKAVVSLLGAGAIAAAGAPAALATTNSFGPQEWSNGTSTARYRAHTGYHYITLLSCNGRYTIDLRVDVISKPDISEGQYSYACNSPGQLYGHYDSYLANYRGHFMQSRSAWYGTARDNHS